MVFDPTSLNFDWSQFGRQYWTYSAYFKKDLKEELPPTMMKPHGPGFTMRVYVDSDHAGDLATCRSRTCFVVFLNRAWIYLFLNNEFHLKLLPLGASSVKWRLQQNMFMACATNFKLWQYLWMSQNLCLATTNMWCETHITLHLLWRRSAIASHSTTFVMEPPEISGALHTWTHTKTWQIYSSSRYLGRSGEKLCVCCYIICKMVQHTCWVAEWFINQPLNSKYDLMKRIIVWPC